MNTLLASLSLLAVIVSAAVIPSSVSNCTEYVELPVGSAYNGQTGQILFFDDFLPPGMSIGEYHVKYGSPFARGPLVNGMPISSGVSSVVYSERGCDEHSAKGLAYNMQLDKCYYWVNPDGHGRFTAQSAWVESGTPSTRWQGYNSGLDDSGLCGIPSAMLSNTRQCITTQIRSCKAVHN